MNRNPAINTCARKTVRGSIAMIVLIGAIVGIFGGAGNPPAASSGAECNGSCGHPSRVAAG